MSEPGRFAVVIALCTIVCASAVAKSPGPLAPVDQMLEIDRFAGTWHVVANIPVRIPFFSDADAVEYTQEVTQTSESTVTLYTRFLRSEHDHRVRDNTYQGFLTDPATNAQWDFQPVWPIRIGCTIFYLSDDYSVAMIGVQSRNWAWIMARDIPVSAEHYATLLRTAGEAGFDVERFRAIPGAVAQP